MSQGNRMRSRFLVGVGLFLLLSLALAGSAAAAEFREGETVVIAADEVIDDDLFISAGRIEVYGTIRGDLLATGGQILVDGQVDGSVFAAGQSLEVSGKVGGSVYGAGYSLDLGSGAEVARNAYFGGFSFRADRQSSIGRSLYVGGYQAILDGVVENDVTIGAGALEVNGTVGGDLNAEVASPDSEAPPPFMPFFPGAVAPLPPGFRMGNQADVVGDLDVVESQPEERPGADRRAALGLPFWLAERLGEFIAILIVGVLLTNFLPELVRTIGAQAQETPFPSAGWGCLVLVVFFVAVPVLGAVILAVAAIGGVVTFGQLFGDLLGLGGAALGLAVAAFLFVLSIVTKAIVAALAGRLILARASPSTLEGRWGGVYALALGAAIYELVVLIPLLGWLVSILVTLVGLGAIFLVLRDRYRPAAAAAA